MGALQKPFVGCRAIILQDNKFLFVQEKGGEMEGIWSPPGGRINVGDTPELTVTRDVKEEVGYDIHIVRKLNVFDSPTMRYPEHVFLAEIIGGAWKPDLVELKDARWLTLKEIEHLTLRGPWILDSIRSLLVYN
ncbi:MAG: NUDIX domain-containing protein [Patescibacteria group bacterium]|jgi:ADP-ribose pyrophosphatase YjhB (NUDIX family)